MSMRTFFRGAGGHRQAVLSYIYSMPEKCKGDGKVNQRTQNVDKTKDDCPTSERECVINGKHFIITRHFKGDKSLREVMTELAIKRANREMGL